MRRAKTQADGAEPTTKTRRVPRTGAGARMSGDAFGLHLVVQIGVIVIAIASFTISFTSLLDVARWQETPEVLHFLTPVMIDAPVVVLGAATIIFKHREQLAAMHLVRTGSVVATAYSSAANFLHTVSVRGLDTYEDWIGATFNASCPWWVLVCTEILGHLITRPKSERGKVQRLQEQLKAANATVRRLEKELRGPAWPLRVIRRAKPTGLHTAPTPETAAPAPETPATAEPEGAMA